MLVLFINRRFWLALLYLSLFLKAVLDVMEKGTIQDIEKRYFGVGYTSQRDNEDLSRDGPSLTSYSFAGLFTITAFLMLLALRCSECSFAISKCHSHKVTSSFRVHSIEWLTMFPLKLTKKISRLKFQAKKSTTKKYYKNPQKLIYIMVVDD